MSRFQKTIARLGGGAMVLFCSMLWAPSADAYPSYDDGFGVGCVSCHNGFQGGNGPLHLQHRTNFGVTTCNLCHPSGGGTTPVLTYHSGPSGGFGCAGCHGVDYGETSPNSGQPKATAYGLRQFHINQGVMVCSTAGGCHVPGSLGHPNPFPAIKPEHVPPPYYNAAYSNLTDPCASVQEDLPFDVDSVGLDNDGDGFADYPADSDCSAPATPTPTPLGIACGTAPAMGCIAPEKGSLSVDEKKPGKEKLKVKLTKLQSTVMQSQFGDPVSGTTEYAICIYDSANQLKGSYIVARAGDTCSGAPCWLAISDKGYKYGDKSAAAADGIIKMKLSGGDAGKGKIKVLGKNTTGQLPLGVAAQLQNQTSAKVQIVTSDAACFEVGLTQVKKADGTVFKAAAP
jgi:hypothetical protein